jgi:hypothetical protein
METNFTACFTSKKFSYGGIFADRITVNRIPELYLQKIEEN